MFLKNFRGRNFFTNLARWGDTKQCGAKSLLTEISCELVQWACLFTNKEVLCLSPFSDRKKWSRLFYKFGVLVRSHNKNVMKKNLLKMKNWRKKFQLAEKSMLELATLSSGRAWHACWRGAGHSSSSFGSITAGLDAIARMWFKLFITNTTVQLYLHRYLCHNVEALFAYIYHFYVIFDTVYITSCANVKYYINLWAFNKL